MKNVMPGEKPFYLKLVLTSVPNEIMKVEGFLEELNKRLQLDDSMFNKLLIATTEAVNNSILHGNKRDPEKKVVLACETTDGLLLITVEDEGPGVNPDVLPDPLAKENLLRENGRGVFLMRSLMESVEFSRFPGGSRVVMKMTLPV
jgi:serine/threonine-protein kinase RsbW